MFIHFFCLCPLGLATKLNFNISKEAYSRFIRHFEKGVNITLQNTGIAKKCFGTSILVTILRHTAVIFLTLQSMRRTQLL